MCIVIDTDIFDLVFSGHTNYIAVKEWIFEGKGKMVFGGTTYAQQVFRKGKSKETSDLITGRNKVANVLAQFEKVHKVNTAEVDAHEARIKKENKDKDFDDQHIGAIISASGCKLICSGDKRSIKFLKEPKVYKGHASVPKFYMSKKNIDLLVDNNIADCCKPAKKLTKAQKEKLRGL